MVIVRSEPFAGGSEGGVYADEEKMKRDDCRERRMRTKNCTMDGRGRSRRGRGGRPMDRDERERKTKD